MRLPFALRVVLKALLQWHAKHDGDFKSSLQRRRVLVLFDRDDCLPRDPNSICEFLLRYVSLSAEIPNLIAYDGHQSALR